MAEFKRLGRMAHLEAALKQAPELANVLQDEDLLAKIDEYFGEGSDVYVEGRQKKRKCEVIGWIVPGNEKLSFKDCTKILDQITAEFNFFNCSIFRLDIA